MSERVKEWSVPHLGDGGQGLSGQRDDDEGRKSEEHLERGKKGV